VVFGMSVIPVDEWLESVQRRLEEIDRIIDALGNMLKMEEYRKKAKVIERDYYRLEIVIVPLSKDEMDIKIYCEPKVKLDPKYIFLIYLTEFFPEVSTDYLDPEKSEMYTKRIVITHRTSPQFFEMDVRRILAKVHRFWLSLMDEEKRKKLDEIIPQIYQLVKSRDAESRRKLSMLRMRVNDLLLYD